MLRVFFEKGVEHGSRLRLVAVEEILLFFAQFFRSFPPASYGSAEGHITKQVEGVGIRLARGGSKFVEINSLVSESSFDGGILFFPNCLTSNKQQ